MNDSAKGRIAKGVTNGRNVRPAPLANSETLRNLFCNEVSKDRELAGEVVIKADNLFLQIGWRVVNADECRFTIQVNRIGCGKDTGTEQRGRVRRNHAGRD